ncbi:MAG: membrane protein FxsA [SAR324 cluster bacterium]|uniref:Membrane protein FxsA n=1 Tax=SAR324 cluster bacterium TaxID=2024889 RepID=A0A2A4T1L9_9DELT|nr:MAG: membrane protein FxsA [SAR324 cluster bacterium]
MFIKLLLAFTLIPTLELYLLVSLGSRLGVFATVAIVILTGMLGAYLAKTQGLQTMSKVWREMKGGNLPAEEILNAFLIVVAAIVLITPGFLTDIVGFLLLTPPVRKVIHLFLQKKLERMLNNRNFPQEPQNIKNIN